MTDGPVFVYAIACGDCVKIGISNSPEQRLKTMLTSMSETPRLVASRQMPNRLHARRLEGIVHWRLMKYRVRERGEWFRVHAKLPSVVV